MISISEEKIEVRWNSSVPKCRNRKNRCKLEIFIAAIPEKYSSYFVFTWNSESIFTRTTRKYLSLINILNKIDARWFHMRTIFSLKNSNACWYQARISFPMFLFLSNLINNNNISAKGKVYLCSLGVMMQYLVEEIVHDLRSLVEGVFGLSHSSLLENGGKTRHRFWSGLKDIFL